MIGPPADRAARRQTYRAHCGRWSAMDLVHFEQGSNRQLAPRVDYSDVAFEMSFS
jgi:hypothetical protein